MRILGVYPGWLVALLVGFPFCLAFGVCLFELGFKGRPLVPSHRGGSQSAKQENPREG